MVQAFNGIYRSKVFITIFLPPTRKVSILLAPGSLTIMGDAAKVKWLHGIPSRKTDMWDGRKYERQRRVSLSLRRLV